MAGQANQNRTRKQLCNKKREVKTAVKKKYNKNSKIKANGNPRKATATRRVALILACALLLTSFTPSTLRTTPSTRQSENGTLQSIFSPLQVSAASLAEEGKTMSTTLDLLVAMVAKNLKPYANASNNLGTSQSIVQKALIAVGEEKGLAAVTDPETNTTSPDQITLVSVYDVIQKIIDDNNATITKNGEAAAEKAAAAAQKKALDDAKKNNSSTDGSATQTEEEIKKAADEAAEKAAEAEREKYKKNLVTYDTTKGVNYNGTLMLTNYTYQNLITDYIRAKEADAALVYDDKIAEYTVKYVSTKNPAGSLTKIIKDVTDYAKNAKVSLTSTNEVNYLDQLTNSHSINYLQYRTVRRKNPPNGTLFIGTYLIDAQAINDVYYRYARDSMGTFNQPIMYYKSELDGGNWKDIMSAAGLTDILPVSDSVADAYLIEQKYRITCVIGADGVPRYPDDDSEADIFGMTSIYDMEAVPEMIPVKTLLDAGVVSQDNRDPSNRFSADVLYRFFNYDNVGNNKAMCIVRNKDYRDYLYDHPDRAYDIIGKNPINLKIPTTITEDEIRFVTELPTKNITLSCNMPQTEDRYNGRNDAFFDQLLSFAEYYTGNNKFKSATYSVTNGGDTSTYYYSKSSLSDSGIYSVPRPVILPAENFSDSEWEMLDWRAQYNPQSVMFLLSGKPSSYDAKQLINTYMATSDLNYGGEASAEVQNLLNNSLTQIIFSNMFGTRDTVDLTKKDRVYLTYDIVNAYPGYINDVYYAWSGRVLMGASVKWVFEQNSAWFNFCGLLYRYMDWMKTMYDTRDNVTNECDTAVSVLNNFYKTERNAGNVDDADTLMRLLSRVDSTRRARMYYNMVYNEKHNVVVGPTLNYMLGVLQTGSGNLGQNYKYITGSDGDYASNDAVVTAVQNAQEQCKDKYNQYNTNAIVNVTTAKGLTSGEGDNTTNLTVLKKKEYDLSMQILRSTSTTERRELLHDLALVYNIEEGAIVVKNEECEMILEVMPDVETLYADAIHATAGQDYLTAAADPNTSKGTLRQYLEFQKEDANAYVAQLQYLIRNYCLRRNTSQGVLYINRRLDWAQNQMNGIQENDPFGAYAKESLEEHIRWLQDILKQVKSGELQGVDELIEDTSGRDYESALLDALDNNDWQAAEAIDKLRERDDDGGLGGNNGTGDGSTGNNGVDDTDGNGASPEDGLIPDLEAKILDDPDRDPDELIPPIQALGELGDANLPDILNFFERRDADPDVIDAIKKAIETAKNPPLNPTAKNPDNYPVTYPYDPTDPNDPYQPDYTDPENPDYPYDPKDPQYPDPTDPNYPNDPNDSNPPEPGDPDDPNVPRGGNGGGGGIPVPDPEYPDGPTGGGGGGGGNGDGTTAGGNTGNDDVNGNANRNGGNGDGTGGNGNGSNTGGNDTNGNGNGGDDGTGDGGNGNGGGMVHVTRRDFIRAIETALGIDWDGISDEDKAVVVAACTRYGKSYGNPAVLNFGRDVMAEAISENNPFFYHQFTAVTTGEYVNLAAVDRPRMQTCYRYVRRGRTVTMTQIYQQSMSASYEFIVGSKDVTDRAGKTTTLSRNTAQQADNYIRGSLTNRYAYIAEEDATKYLGITCEYVPNADYAVFCTTRMEKRVKVLIETLTEMLAEIEAGA